MHSEWDGAAEYVKINCLLPGHLDDKPSYAVYSDHAYCFGCNKWVGYRDHCKLVGGEPTKEVRTLPPPKQYSEDELFDMAELYAQELRWNGKESYLLGRGLNLNMIRYAQLGYYRDAFTIPIYGPDWSLQTIRFRRDPAFGNGEPKYWGLKGMNQPYLYTPRRLAPHVVWTEGELDALIACQLGFCGISATNGCGVDPDLFIPTLRENGVMKVKVCYDNDGPGVRRSHVLARKLAAAGIVYKFVRFPYKDLTEFVQNEGEDKAKEGLSGTE